jgi:hypothetical protein
LSAQITQIFKGTSKESEKTSFNDGSMKQNLADICRVVCFIKITFMSSEKEKTSEIGTEKKKTWLKRLGWAGILFFVIKGIISTSLIILGGNTILKSCN